MPGRDARIAKEQCLHNDSACRQTTRATHVARATASCCAAVGAGACGSATASARSPPQARAIPAPTAARPTDNMRPRRPMPRWRRACRTPPGRAPPHRAWTPHRWRLLRARATHVARATASCCAAVGAGASGSATASARPSLENISAIEAPTAAPPTERRHPLPRQTRARPLQFRRDPSRPWASNSWTRVFVICLTRA